MNWDARHHVGQDDEYVCSWCWPDISSVTEHSVTESPPHTHTHTLQGHYYSSSPLTSSLFYHAQCVCASYYSLQHSEGRQRRSHAMKSNKGILHVLLPTSCFVPNVWGGGSYAGALLDSKSSTSQESKKENRGSRMTFFFSFLSFFFFLLLLFPQHFHGWPSWLRWVMAPQSWVMGFQQKLWLQHCIISRAFSRWPTQPSCTLPQTYNRNIPDLSIWIRFY